MSRVAYTFALFARGWERAEETVCRPLRLRSGQALRDLVPFLAGLPRTYVRGYYLLPLRGSFFSGFGRSKPQASL